MVAEKTLKDIENNGKVNDFRLAQKTNALYLLESLRNNTLLFDGFNDTQKNAIKWFITWYFEC